MKSFNLKNKYQSNIHIILFIFFLLKCILLCETFYYIITNINKMMEKLLFLFLAAAFLIPCLTAWRIDINYKCPETMPAYQFDPQQVIS